MVDLTRTDTNGYQQIAIFVGPSTLLTIKAEENLLWLWLWVLRTVADALD